MRIDKLLNDLNIASRKDAKKILKSGLIEVNGVIIKDASVHIDEINDVVKYKGEILNYQKYHYFMLNKPDDVVSATEDNLSKTVIDIFKNENIKNLFPVGRLDKDTTGLLLVTDDGDFAHRLTSPNHHVSKTYEVLIDHPLEMAAINKLESGVELINDGITKPAVVNIISDTVIHLTITEGKYHQVKRMLAAVNNKVIKLKRLSIGDLQLDNNLQEGEYRQLTKEEIDLFER